MNKYLGLFKNDVTQNQTICGLPPSYVTRSHKICMPYPPMTSRFPNSQFWVTKKKHSDIRLTNV